jgi:hypothetical protein
MRAKIKELRYWKTEHQEDGCQDAHKYKADKGLFVVADGAGTTLFPALWAKVLVEHFVNIPLMRNDPFEVEWWVRLAQKVYDQNDPAKGSLQDWSIRAKAQKQSSDATLASLRFSEVHALRAQAELLVFGDSCVIIGNTTTKLVKSFVLEQPADFAQAPICIPSSLKFFNRHFHTCSLKTVQLEANHIVILASDAVSKWILSGGGGRYTSDTPCWDAFQAVYNTSVEDWSSFIERCRESQEMVNDDSTALILTLLNNGTEEGVPLGATPEYDKSTIDERKEAFDKAYQEQNSELLAVYYGDGHYLSPLLPNITDQEIKNARNVADALQELLRAFRQAQNMPGLAAKMQPVWDKYASVLRDEKCAANIRKTLSSNGVTLDRSAPTPSSMPAVIRATGASEQTPPATAPTIIQPNPSPLAETDSEQEAKKLQEAFLRAYSNYFSMNEDERKNNYQTFLETADALNAAHMRNPQIYSPTEGQEELIRLARSYKQAIDEEYIVSVRHSQEELKAFRDELGIGRLERIAKFSGMLQSNKGLRDDERQILQLAAKFVEAYSSDNDDSIVTICKEIKKLPYYIQITFNEKERLRLIQADEYITKMGTVVATVKDKLIALGEVRRVSILRRTILSYWINKFQQEMNESANEAAKTEKRDRIAHWKEYIDPNKIAGNALKDILDDIIIREKLKNPDLSNTIKNQIAQGLANELEYFRLRIVPDYDAFLREHKLSHQKVELVLGIFVRYQCFKAYIESQQKAAQPDPLYRSLDIGAQNIHTWLEKQREEVIYNYSSKFEQRAKAMAIQLGWLKQ